MLAIPLEIVVLNVAQENNMNQLIVFLIFIGTLLGCTPGPTTEMSANSVKQHVTEMAGTEVEVLVESQKDTDGDFQNLQRELRVVFLLPSVSNFAEVKLLNGLILKRDVRSAAVKVLVVHAKDKESWKTVKVSIG
jgi:hypothetical protein